MIVFSADHHFHIGDLHLRNGRPCQDYAFSGQDGNVTFAIVSDGCSRGGNTDVGARLLSLCAAAVMCEYGTTQQTTINEMIIREMNLHQRIFLGGIQRSLRLSSQDMLATCAYAYLTPDGGFIHLRGDGVIARVYTDGSIKASSFIWAKNTPFYPIYTEDNCIRFISEHGGDLSAKVLFEERNDFDPETREWKYNENVSHTLEEGITGITISIPQEDIEQRLAFIALFSDGVTQVQSLPWFRVITELLAFKSKSGEFAKRRMIRFLKELQGDGKALFDDISYAVIQITRGS